MNLYKTCEYSFNDLIKTSGDLCSIEYLLNLSQEKRNEVVKELCGISGWYWKDVKGNDGKVYTSFSPYLYRSHSILKPKKKKKYSEKEK